MKITEDPQFRAQILKQIAEREFYERKGTHGSDLIYCLNKQALRKLKPIPNTDEQILIFSIGWSTQRWLTGTFEPDKEYEVDGIVVTPDFIVSPTRLDGSEFAEGMAQWEHPSITYLRCPWELKATWQSTNKAVEDNLHWLRQLMAECYVTGTTTAILSRFEIEGDWKQIFKPKGYKEWSPEELAQFKREHPRPSLSAWRVEFEQEELDKFWGWMKERKVLYEEILSTGVLLPKVVALASGMQWECGWCPYKEDCDGNG